MPKEVTVKEFAALERVTPRTVRLWIAKGAVVVRRTPGGGIRILDRRAESRPTGDVCMSSDEVCGSPST